MRSRFVPVVAALAVSLFAVSLHAQTFKIDPVHSAVIFSNHHMNAGYVYGRFNDVSGSFVLGVDEAKFSVDATIKVDSLDTNNAKRDGHLKGPDFFNSAQFPTITFKSTKVSAGKEKDTYEVVGDLSLHGVSKPITVIVRKTGIGGMGKEVRGGIEAAFTIKRTDYGMTNMIGPSGDEVRLTIALEGIKE
jgi:polyisoprenoid-binding protein YceI